MIGKELKDLESLENAPKDIAAAERSRPFAEARSLGRPGAVEPFTLTIHEGRSSAWPGCSAPAAPRWRACCSAPTTPPPANCPSAARP
nr:hypothetical protein GCM10020093_002230 [Planobispora longispora]